ncbi:uncharacterized protein LOC133829844 isoform X4 [Humulus lupulus]|uniref:uncharacterized protein LOC133782519 isoform X4 n=2 Tax=Humulus lupulus TaxID=3486 RepID=UPI002B411389|nr:uncharacterized protein LOC133782519 isoform X4 [Humulus lupulus]XP_062077841.1 uncharacterized protein LOC133782526 isoform X4 [Humulus lupulus]XP_062113781.1 uncharacterized protein LOC133824820 isoform X4 [Humulus lupulus]XP_062115643.1 uncharacterized protein LOC133829844 isoform X4 [Humulus lupulus]
MSFLCSLRLSCCFALGDQLIMSTSRCDSHADSVCRLSCSFSEEDFSSLFQSSAEMVDCNRITVVELGGRPLGDVTGRGIDSNEPIDGGMPGSGSMLSSNPRSSISLGELTYLRRHYEIPDTISLHAPAKAERPDWHLPGWVCLYELPFKEGLRFPIPRLVVELCEYHEISPGQLMPNSWRILMSLEVLCERHKITLGVADLLRAYYLKAHLNDKGRYQLTTRGKDPPLIISLKSGDKRWKDRYFFVPFVSLGLPADSRIPCSWSPACRLRVEYLWDSRESSGRLKSILAIPEAEREWSDLLSESSLRQSSLWRSVEKLPEDVAMSRPFTLPLTGSNALERLRQAKKSSVGSSEADREVVVPPADPPVLTRSQTKKKKKAVRDDSSDPFSDTVALSFPSNAAAYSEIGPHLGEIDKLLWPEDDHRMEQVGTDGSIDTTVSHLFQGLQGVIWLKKKIKSLMATLKEVRSQRNDLRGEVSRLKDSKKESDQLIADLKAQLESKEADVEKLRVTLGQVDDLKAEVASLENRMLVIGLEAEIQCRGVMASEFRDGKADSWDVPKYIADLEELEKMRAEEITRAEELATSFGIMTTNDLVVDD